MKNPFKHKDCKLKDALAELTLAGAKVLEAFSEWIKSKTSTKGN